MGPMVASAKGTQDPLPKPGPVGQKDLVVEQTDSDPGQEFERIEKRNCISKGSEPATERS